MSSFDIAVEVLLKAEDASGTGIVTKDAGGTTKWGISQKSYPNLDIASLSRDDAIAIYKRDWWRQAYAQIISQQVANKVFCMAPNMGNTSAHICLQRALRAVTSRSIAEDGVLGSATLTLVNATDGAILLPAYRSELAAHYRLINDPVYLQGWLNRAYAT